MRLRPSDCAVVRDETAAGPMLRVGCDLGRTRAPATAHRDRLPTVPMQLHSMTAKPRSRYKDERGPPRARRSISGGRTVHPFDPPWSSVALRVLRVNIHLFPEGAGRSPDCPARRALGSAGSARLGSPHPSIAGFPTRSQHGFGHCVMALFPASFPSSRPPGAGESGVPPPPKAQPAPGNAQVPGTASGSGISGKPAGVPYACRTDEVSGAPRAVNLSGTATEGGQRHRHGSPAHDLCGADH